MSDVWRALPRRRTRARERGPSAACPRPQGNPFEMRRRAGALCNLKFRRFSDDSLVPCDADAAGGVNTTRWCCCWRLRRLCVGACKDRYTRQSEWQPHVQSFLDVRMPSVQNCSLKSSLSRNFPALLQRATRYCALVNSCLMGRLHPTSQRRRHNPPLRWWRGRRWEANASSRWSTHRCSRSRARSAGQGLTHVHFSAQLEPCLTNKNTLHTLNIP
jgi:hypothetical protein